ncbi:MAG: GIY-YIG nuclease family protein [Candidatus Doudnabacteria bacterium]|nr:GIY-YIG nuclease family protein [Candidatus Doudnabacteria bacterium]
MYKVYILKSIPVGSYYIGSCEDVAVRLKQHNHGSVKSTKRYSPWEVVYTERLATLKDARAREKQIKSWKKRATIEKLINSKN